MSAHRDRKKAGSGRCRAILFPLVLIVSLVFVAGAASGSSHQEAAPSSAAVGREQSSATPSIAGMRDFLAAFGIGESSLAQAQDGRPVGLEDEELLVRLLDRVAALQPAEIADWSEAPPDWRAFWERPATLRGRLFAVEGRVRSVQAIDSTPELSVRSGIKRYYVCTVTDDQGMGYAVYTRRIPAAWLPRIPAGDRVRVSGIFMKWSGDSPDSPRPVLVTDRPAWFPDNLLGRLGMDCALLDDVPIAGKAQTDAVAEEPTGLERFFLTGRDREAFYQMLAAAGRARPGELYQYARRESESSETPVSPVIKLFNEPASQLGRLVLLYGTARRIEKIEVHDADIRRRFGITHYYSIYLFTQDSQNNPLVCCVRELPPGIPLGEGPRYAADVAVAAFFYKTWGYRPERPAADTGSQTAWQLAPLLVGREALPLAESGSHNTAALTGIVITGLLFVIVLVWLWVWIVGRRDRAALSELRRRIGEMPATRLPSDGEASHRLSQDGGTDGESPERPPDGSIT